MLHIISATTVAISVDEKCQFCHKKEAMAGTKTCSTCHRRLNTRSRHILAGVPKRPVWRSDLFDNATEEALEASIFANDRGVLAPVPFSPESYEDDPGGSYDTARRAREDGR